MSKFDKIIPKGSVPNCQLQIANRYDNRWFKCKLKPPKKKKKTKKKAKDKTGTGDPASATTPAKPAAGLPQKVNCLPPAQPPSLVDRTRVPSSTATLISGLYTGKH